MRDIPEPRQEFYPSSPCCCLSHFMPSGWFLLPETTECVALTFSFKFAADHFYKKVKLKNKKWNFTKFRIFNLNYFRSISHKCGWKNCGQLPGPRLPRTSLQGVSDVGPGQPSLKEKSHLEPSRDGGDMARERKEPIQDMMQEDHQPTERDDY